MKQTTLPLCVFVIYCLFGRISYDKVKSKATSSFLMFFMPLNSLRLCAMADAPFQNNFGNNLLLCTKVAGKAENRWEQ